MQKRGRPRKLAATDGKRTGSKNLRKQRNSSPPPSVEVKTSNPKESRQTTMLVSILKNSLDGGNSGNVRRKSVSVPPRPKTVTFMELDGSKNGTTGTKATGTAKKLSKRKYLAAMDLFPCKTNLLKRKRAASESPATVELVGTAIRFGPVTRSSFRISKNKLDRTTSDTETGKTSTGTGVGTRSGKKNMAAAAAEMKKTKEETATAKKRKRSASVGSKTKMAVVVPVAGEELRKQPKRASKTKARKNIIDMTKAHRI
jgi:hypothetical protein